MGFFKAYDMRGTFGTDFDLDTVRRVGRVLPGVVAGCNSRRFGDPVPGVPRFLIGRDCRLSGGAVRDALVEGLLAAGAAVTDLGPTTTPMVYYFTAADGYDGSVMITASHNPPSDNGLKVSMRTAMPVGYADGLDEVERIVRGGGGAVAAPCVPAGTVTAADADSCRQRYVEWQREHAPADLSGLRFAVDCSNGMAALTVRRLFPGAIFLNDVPNGGFPAHSPNPLDAAAREQLSAFVREKKLDCGVIFDGDADRAMFVDERGNFVQPDYLIPLVARAMSGGRGDGAVVLHDVRTSRGAVETLREDGFSPVMVPVGHAFAKPKMRELGALCGGELAGHYYFGDFFGCDSGVLAARRILGEIAAAKRRGGSFSGLMAPIVSRYANSGELNFRVEDKEAAIARVLAVAAAELPAEISRSTMDGLRLEYAEGWVNVRKSNTEPYLRLLVECDTRERLEDWLARLKGAIGNA